MCPPCFVRHPCLEMKVDIAEGNRPAGTVGGERQIHQGFTVNEDAEVGRSGSNRAVAVVQQHQAGGASGAGGPVDGRTPGVVDGVVGVGLPVRNGVLTGVGSGSVGVVALHQHGGHGSVHGRAFVGSDEHQVGGWER